MRGEAEMMLEVLDSIQNAPESVEIIVGMINDPDPSQTKTVDPVDEAAVRAALELLLTRDFAVVERWADESGEYVQVDALQGFDAAQLWVRPTEAGTAWLHANAPPDWYSD